MKKFSKILITSTVTVTGMVSVGSIVGISNLSSPNFNSKNSTLLQNNNSSSTQKFNSIEEAIADYEKKYVSNGRYIGDIYKESSSSYNYRKIYLDKNEVHKYDPSKIEPTYKTSYGTYTNDIDVSKKSFIEQPIVAYKDKVGNIHYTENDANNSNAKNIAFNSIAFYEINDYSKSNDKPEKVKINPLNTNDLTKLKNMSILNLGKSNSNFSTSYFYADEKTGQVTTTYKAPSKPGEYISLDENKKTTLDKIIYTINFNGVPLYKINHDWISENFFTSTQLDPSNNKPSGGQLNEEMKKDPAKYLTDYIVSKLNQTNETVVKDFFDRLFKNLENISNNFKLDNKGNLYLEKKAGQAFNRNDLMVNFVSDTNVSNTEFKDKFLDNTKSSQFGISSDELNMGLKANKNDDDSLLITNTGTFKSINEYNKTLKNILNSNNKLSDQLLKVLKSNMASSLNDVVFLFDKNSPFQIKYNEYANHNLYFNESMTANNNSISFIYSIEQKKEYIEKNSSSFVETIWLVYDKRGNLLSNSFDRQVAIDNAINTVKPEIDNESVYYTKDGKKLKIKNQINELNILQLDGQSYGFTSYQELYNCLYEYIKMSSIINGDGTITPPKPPVEEKVPFEPSTINTSNISGVLSKFSSLDEVNKLTVTEKFDNFKTAFNITTIESWNKFIGNGLTFANKEGTKLLAENNDSLTEMKTATMTITLQNGNKFSDGKTSFSTDIQYTPNTTPITPPNIDELPDQGIDGKKTYSSTQDVVTALSIIIGVLIIAEVIVLSLTIINRRKSSSSELKVLNKYYKEKK